MGLTDMMKQSNQSTNENVGGMFRHGKDDKSSKTNGAANTPAEIAVIPGDVETMLTNSVWSSDGLLSSSRLFQRPSSTPPTNVDAFQGTQRQFSKGYGFGSFQLRETLEENNQEDEADELDRHDLVMPIGKHIQRAWSAPPVPENFEAFFTQKASKSDRRHNESAVFDKSGLSGISENRRSNWDDENCGSDKSFEKTSMTTVSPLGSPLVMEQQPEVESIQKVARRDASRDQRGMSQPERRYNSSLMTLVDRVQEDFPRTPSPVFGCPAGSTGVLPVRSLDQSMAGAMNQLRIDSGARMNIPQPTYRSDRVFTPSTYQSRAHEVRQPQRVQIHPTFVSPYPVVAPPGFHSTTARGIYGAAMTSDSRAHWARGEDQGVYSNGRFPVPMDYGMFPPTGHAPVKGDFYANKFGGGMYSPHEAQGRPFHSHMSPAFANHSAYDIQGHQAYSIPHPAPMYRSKPGPIRRHEYTVHPAHSYSSTSLLEEFKGAAKSDRWDLRTIQGHLLEFARDQAGSRFIQQKLEKADDRARDEAFNEVYPEALLLMTDVFGNYVIQKFFDHGSIDQQRLLVNLMKKNMVNLALQVYGCRVIQKALEVTEVAEQLLLIREMRGHVLKCVVDQNGNHVLQKCIEAASRKKCMSGGADNQVLGQDIQFIIDDFIGQAAVLSTHAYGCRVIQRVLEHCTPDQIRPIVNEIIFKCRELVKDQFGNYVVQHVVTHGEKEQRDIVMQAILPDVAKWSQHKYASNVVEACLDCATKNEIGSVIDLILDCDESGSSCALLPMMKHMYGNYVVQKLLDRADRNDRQRIVRIIQHNADYLKRFTYGKHVLSRLEREANGNYREHGHGRYC